LQAIHSSASYASIPPAITGGYSGRSVSQAQSSGSFHAFLRNISAGQTSDDATATPGSSKKDASPKGSNRLATTTLPWVNLPVQSDSNSSLRLRLALGSATDESEAGAEAAPKNGAEDDAPSIATDDDTDNDTTYASLNAFLSQTILYPAVVTPSAVGNQLQAKAGFAFTANRSTSSSAKASMRGAATPSETNVVDQSASTSKASNQTVLQTPLTQPDRRQPTSGQAPDATDQAAVKEGNSLTAGTDRPRVEVSTGPTGGPRGELAFALRLRNTESPASSSPVNETPDSGSPTADTPGVTTPRTGLSMMEAHNSERAMTANTQLVSPASARHAHTSETAAPSQANNGAQSPDTGTGTNHNSDGGHQAGNRDTAGSYAASQDQQRMTAGADSTSIHGQGVAATGAVPGGADMSAATAPKMPAAAKTSSPAASETLPTTTPMPVAEDNPVVGPAQPISISVSAGNDQKVEIRLMERAGEILVSVRTPDQTLAHSLRDDLGSLTGKLNQSGYNTEAFAPTGSASSNLSDRGADKHGASEERESDGGQRQNSGQRGSADEQQSQQEGRGKRPAWLEELNHSMASRQSNRSNSWQHL